LRGGQERVGSVGKLNGSINWKKKKSTARPHWGKKTDRTNLEGQTLRGEKKNQKARVMQYLWGLKGGGGLAAPLGYIKESKLKKGLSRN